MNHARPIRYYCDMDLATLLLLAETFLALAAMILWWGG